MNTTILTRDSARVIGISAVVLTGMLAALLAVFVLAKPSGAQVITPLTLTVDPTRVDFATVVTDDRVVGSVVVRQITVTNQGSTPITIGGVELTGDAGEILDFSTSIGADGLTVLGNGASNTFEVRFNPSAEGTRDAVLQLLDDTTGDVIGLVDPNGNPLLDDAGNVVQGIILTGTGAAPNMRPAANCTIVGTNSGERLTGTPGKDVICAMGGNDKVNGLAGNDILRGGSGKDKLTDKNGKDKAYGESGKDTINVKDRQRGDVANGGPQRDRIRKDKGDKGKRT